MVAQPIEGIIADPHAGLDCVSTDSFGFSKGCLLAAADAIGEIAENWENRIDDLICSGGRPR